MNIEMDHHLGAFPGTDDLFGKQNLQNLEAKPAEFSSFCFLTSSKETKVVVSYY